MNTSEAWMTESDKLYEVYKGANNLYACIAKALRDKGYDIDRGKVRDRYRVRGSSQKPPVVCDKADDVVQAQKEKSVVIENREPSVLTVNWKGNRLVRFGLVGDTHINNKYAQLSYLRDMYDRLATAGIKHVYHTGDIDDGEQMRPGHQYECYTQGADAHVEEIAKVYPRREGVTTHFITGNHDASLIKRAGYNIGPAIAREREDMDYLGADCAIVMLTPNCSLELRHPWDGSAYALSYKPQKIIDSLAGGEKTNIMAIGHYHKAEYLFYRNIHCFQTGTFCAQTPFMKGKAISAHMGGWIVEIEVDERGYIQSIMPQFIPYYVAIPSDYLNGRR